VLALLAATGAAGCGEATPVSPMDVSSSSSTAASGVATPGGTVVGDRRVVLLDPGHNGRNSLDPKAINKQVPDGRGGTKACNTAGTATNDGYTEHEFAWTVTQKVKAVLERSGITVKLTRDNDTGVGPCVDVRGTMAEEVDADAVVSIHADGGPPRGRGFHVAYSSPALSQSQGEPSVSLAVALRDALRGAGLTPSTYVGKDGLSPRKDLAGLNLARRPAALVECDNMRNNDQAVMLTSSVGQNRIADAIAAGIVAWLNKH
jgi:N-acetylmuramoyl-L-alanine amidase